MKKQITQYSEPALWSEWLNRAVKPMDDHPDRDWVRQELLEHLKDKAADLERIFPTITRQEAEQEALLRLGDPSEIGAELAKAHSRILGAVYWITYAIILWGSLGLLLMLPIYLLRLLIPLMLYSPSLI